MQEGAGEPCSQGPVFLGKPSHDEVLSELTGPMPSQCDAEIWTITDCDSTA